MRSIFYYKPDPPSYVHSVTFDEARAKSEPRKRGELPKDRPPNIKELFDAMDKDDSGTLTRDEVRWLVVYGACVSYSNGDGLAFTTGTQ